MNNDNYIFCPVDTGNPCNCHCNSFVEVVTVPTGVDGAEEYAVECTTCNMRGPAHSEKSMAIEDWNMIMEALSGPKNLIEILVHHSEVKRTVREVSNA